MYMPCTLLYHYTLCGDPRPCQPVRLNPLPILGIMRIVLLLHCQSVESPLTFHSSLRPNKTAAMVRGGNTYNHL